MNEPKRERGGRREGAGRPPKYGQPMKRVDVRLPPDWIEALQAEFGSFQQAVETLVKNHLGK